MNNPIPILIILIYLPIFVLAIISKPFRNKFMKVHSKTIKQSSIEILVGVIYFLIIILSIFTTISNNKAHLIIGSLIYIIGLTITYTGYIAFIQTPKNKLTTTFPYNISRNPTYFFGLIAILGIAILTISTTLLALLIVQFILTNQIIKIEEKFCKKKYKKEYINYVKKVRRYL